MVDRLLAQEMQFWLKFAYGSYANESGGVIAGYACERDKNAFLQTKSLARIGTDYNLLFDPGSGINFFKSTLSSIGQ